VRSIRHTWVFRRPPKRDTNWFKDENYTLPLEWNKPIKNICPKGNQVFLFSKSHTKNFYFYYMPNDIVYTYMYNVYVIYNAWIIRFEKPITRSMASSAKLSKISIPWSSFAFNFPDFCQVKTKTCIGYKTYE